ncbi:phospholipase A1-like [Contarinia nasturtii]|uniref:phospholipase A1-like n=1 Tax=Contarinia nasturtii TaxID=265458 RepID=UPI0012D46ADB|nr:phospholipase A1-like [Contarinia nasturtii]
MFMLCYKVTLSLLLLTVKFSEIKALPDVEKEIQISCVSNENATEFSIFHLKYDPIMAKHGYTFFEGEIEKLKEMIGHREKIIFFFLGHEDFLHKISGKSFLIAKEQASKTGATACTISYDFLGDVNELLKFSQYFWSLDKRIPRVVEMASSFIQNIVDSKHFKITLSSVYLTGFCLGGHVAGMVGNKLREIYKGHMVSAVWAFDPPAVGFPHSEISGKPRRVQKGDAKFVGVFHTSTIGFNDTVADVDIIVNGAELQPGCQFERIKTACSHFSGFILRELIVMESEQLDNGKLIVHGANKSDQFTVDLTNPPHDKKGVYHVQTGMIFETKTEGFLRRMSNSFLKTK